MCVCGHSPVPGLVYDPKEIGRAGNWLDLLGLVRAAPGPFDGFVALEPCLGAMVAELVLAVVVFIFFLVLYDLAVRRQLRLRWSGDVDPGSSWRCARHTWMRTVYDPCRNRDRMGADGALVRWCGYCVMLRVLQGQMSQRIQVQGVYWCRHGGQEEAWCVHR